jgi:hypothetical protein
MPPKQLARQECPIPISAEQPTGKRIDSIFIIMYGVIMNSLLYKFAIALVLVLAPFKLFAQTADNVGFSVSDTKIIITSVVSIEPKERVVVLKDKDGELKLHL